MNKSYIILFFSLTLIIAACGEKKKKSMSGDEAVTIQDFIESYNDINLPFTYSDSIFPKNENDSFLIDKGIFFQFVPDSIVSATFNKNAKIRFYSIGKFKHNDEIYIVSKAIVPDKKAIFITAYDKKNNFIAGMPLIVTDRTNGTHQKISIDKRLNISKEITGVNPDGTLLTGHDMYILNNSAKKFMLIMTDSLGYGATELVNPLDTLPSTQKFSGDYGDNKNNLVSIRDGLRDGRLRFFIHLEDQGKNCQGELKGEAIFIHKDTAEYKQGGDPCVIKFIFSGTSVRLKEVEGCGSRLGALQCTFNGIYTRKKTVKKPAENQPATKKRSKK